MSPGWPVAGASPVFAPTRSKNTPADRRLDYSLCKAGGPENVIAGTDCGFAQADVIERVPAPVMWAKFQALVEGAALASKELF